jgi:hypothetical protein
MKREHCFIVNYVCGISLGTVEKETIKITKVTNTSYFIYCFEMNCQIKFCYIIPLLVMILKEENVVHTSQKLKLCIEDLHLTSLNNPKILPELRFGVTSSSIPNI